MRFLSCLLIAVSFIVCAGCSEQEPAPAEETAPAAGEPAVEQAPITAEDFESGEPENVVPGDETVDENIKAGTEDNGSDH